MKTQWWNNWKFLLKCFLLIKCLQITKWVFRSSPSPLPFSHLEPGLGSAYHKHSGTFTIMSEKNVSWTLLPPSSCNRSTLLLLTVSSGPLNSVQREVWRGAVREAGLGERLRLVFLVSQGEGQGQQRLEQEHAKWGDIVQTSLEDGHRKLGYKILTGYVYTNLFCPEVRFVGKTDDNIVLDLGRVVRALESRLSHPERERFLCSNSVSRNIGVGRVARGHMRGNWSLTKEDLEDDIMPDFCSGFLYITSPRVGYKLVQAGMHMYPEKEVRIAEDYLVAGVLRQRLGVPLDMIEGHSLTSKLWTSTLSHCPWMTTTKQTFFNDLVLRKNSARSNVQYVGTVTQPQVWRFFICLHLEAALEILETRAPGLIPDFIWDVCAR